MSWLCTHKQYYRFRSEKPPHCPYYWNSAALFINSEPEIVINFTTVCFTFDRGILFEYSLVAICDNVMAMKMAGRYLLKIIKRYQFSYSSKPPPLKR